MSKTDQTLPDNEVESLEARFTGRQGEFQLDARFTVPARGVTALFGPSGCGKTSVLRCVAGLNRMADGFFALKGAVWQDGQRFVPTHKRPIGYVFQEASLFAHMSVADNLTFGQTRLKLGPAPEGSILNKEDIVSLLGLDRLLDRSPVHLSGGERQRVAIGRALLTRPQILLMDEPMAALDRFARNEILPYLEALHAELSIPVLYVSHDISEVERLADHMVLMDKGHVQAVGPLQDLLSNPALPLVRMPEAASVLEGKLSGIDADYGIGLVDVGGMTFQVPGLSGTIGDPVRLRIAASDVALNRNLSQSGLSILNDLVARIETIEPFGDHMVNVFLRLGEQGSGPTLIARITRKSLHALALEEGATVQALVKSVSLV